MMHRVAGRLQQAYADIGISLDLQVLKLDDLLARLGNGRFDAFVSPVVSGYGLGMPYVHFGAHDHPRVIDHGYTAAAAAAERVRAATSDQALEAAIRDFHRVLIEDLAGLLLFWQETSRAVGRRIKVPADWSGDVLKLVAPLRSGTPRRDPDHTSDGDAGHDRRAAAPLILGIVAGYTLRTTTRQSVMESHAAIAARAAAAIPPYMRSSERLVRLGSVGPYPPA